MMKLLNPKFNIMYKSLFMCLLFVINLSDSIGQNRLEISTGLKIRSNSISITNAMQNIMGRDMNINTKGDIDFDFTVLSQTPEIRLKSKIARIQIETESMGKKTNFDSNIKEDIETPIGSIVSKTIDSPFDLYFKTNGALIKNINIEPNTEALENIISSLENVGSDLFLLIPGTLNIGFSWVEEVKENDGNEKKIEYTIESISNRLVKLKFNGNSKNKVSKLIQQNESIISASNVIRGEIILDFGGLIKEKRTDISSTGVTEFMGQSAKFSFSQSIVTTNTF